MKHLSFGLMRLPLLDPNDSGSIDLPAVIRMADRFLEGGFTHFDTAYPYHGGKSEEALREAVVRRHPRQSFAVTDKLPVWAIEREEQLEEIFNQQLERCGVEYFDYYWLHALSAQRVEKCRQLRAFEFLARKQAEGRVRHTGFSFHDSAQVLDEILTAHPELEYVQLQLNYLDWETETVQSRLCYETVRRHGKRVMVMEPVKGGALAQLPPKAEALLKELDPDLSPAAWALRFAGGLEGVDMVLSGMSNLEQLEENMRTFDPLQPLSPREREALSQAAELIRQAIAIPCTACRYCTDGCPQHIPIPDCFQLYNNAKLGKRSPAGSFDQLVQTFGGKPSDCIACRQCESHCPQNLPIVQYLEQAAKLLED